jgi:hypothetical protein
MTELRAALAQVVGAHRPSATLNLIFLGACSRRRRSVSSIGPCRRLEKLDPGGGGCGAAPWCFWPLPGRRYLSAFLMTFMINLLVGCFPDITLPSLTLPVSRLLVAILRAVLWGVILNAFALRDHCSASPGSPCGVAVLLLEREAQVLGRWLPTPRGKRCRFPVPSHRVCTGRDTAVGFGSRWVSIPWPCSHCMWRACTSPWWSSSFSHDLFEGQDGPRLPRPRIRKIAFSPPYGLACDSAAGEAPSTSIYNRRKPWKSRIAPRRRCGDQPRRARGGLARGPGELQCLHYRRPGDGRP